MTALVTVAQVDAALRLNLEADLGDPSGDGGDDARLQDIELKILQASDIVLDYVTHPDKGTWTAETAPGRVTAAVILVVKCLFDDAGEARLLAGLSGGDLNNPLVALLYRLRDPVLA